MNWNPGGPGRLASSSSFSLCSQEVSPSVPNICSSGRYQLCPFKQQIPPCSQMPSTPVVSACKVGLFPLARWPSVKRKRRIKVAKPGYFRSFFRFQLALDGVFQVMIPINLVGALSGIMNYSLALVGFPMEPVKVEKEGETRKHETAMANTSVFSKMKPRLQNTVTQPWACRFLFRF